MAGKKYRQIWLWVLLLVLAGGGIFGVLRYRGGQEVPALFGDLPAAMQPEGFLESAVAKRWRWVHLDSKGLNQLSERGARFQLNFFPDVQVTAVVGVHKTHQHGAQSVLGYVENAPWGSTVVLSHSDGIMAGTVMLGDGRQMMIRHVKDGIYVVLEVDQAKIEIGRAHV